MPLALACNNAQKIKVHANPDGPIDGNVTAEVISGDGTSEQIDQLTFWIISGSAAAQTVYKISADADPSSDKVMLDDTITLDVSQKMASNLGLSADAPEDK